MAAQQLLKIVYALDIKFCVRWCTCSMWRMLLPYYLLFLISIVFETNQRTSRTELARLVMGTIFLVGERSEPLSRVFNDQPRDIYIYIYGRCPTVLTFLIRMPMYV